MSALYARAPEFSLEGAGEQPLRLADYRVVLLYYSYLLNDRLDEQMDQLATLNRRWGAKGLVIVAVLYEGAEVGWYKYRGEWIKSRNEFQRLVDRWGGDMVFGIDDGSVRPAYKAAWNGSLFLIDRQGRLRWRQDSHRAGGDGNLVHAIGQLIGTERVAAQE